MEKKNIKFIWKDKFFWASIILPLIVWVLYVVISQKSPNLYYIKEKQFQLLMFVFVYPIVEEVIFRGLIQDYLNRKFNHKKNLSISYANIETSILFVLFHLIYQSAVWSLMVFIPSVIFGYFKDKYGKLQLPIFLHCFYNAGFLLFIK